MRGSEWRVGGVEAQPEPLANDDAAPVIKRPPARRLAAPPPLFFSVHHGPSQDPSSAAPVLLRMLLLDHGYMPHLRARTALLRIAISGALCCGALFNCAIGFITSPLLPVRSNSISIHLRRGGVAPQRSRQDCSLCGTRGFGCVRVAMAASVDGGR